MGLIEKKNIFIYASFSEVEDENNYIFMPVKSKGDKFKQTVPGMVFVEQSTQAP